LETSALSAAASKAAPDSTASWVRVRLRGRVRARDRGRAIRLGFGRG